MSLRNVALLAVVLSVIAVLAFMLVQDQRWRRQAELRRVVEEKKPRSEQKWKGDALLLINQSRKSSRKRELETNCRVKRKRNEMSVQIG